MLFSTRGFLQDSETNRACWSQDGVSGEVWESDHGQSGFGCGEGGPQVWRSDLQHSFPHKWHRPGGKCCLGNKATQPSIGPCLHSLTFRSHFKENSENTITPGKIHVIILSKLTMIPPLALWPRPHLHCQHSFDCHLWRSNDMLYVCYCWWTQENRNFWLIENLCKFMRDCHTITLSH